MHLYGKQHKPNVACNNFIRLALENITNKCRHISFCAEHCFIHHRISWHTLILIALHKASSIFPPTKLLFRCLAVTDLFVGFISHPVSAFLLINFSIFKTHESYNYNRHFIFVISNSVYFLSCVVLPLISVLTSAAIGVDRLLALLLRRRYRHVVTLRRVRAVIVCSCSIGILCGASGLAGFVLCLSKTTFLLFNLISFGSGVLALVISTCSYMKIFLRRHQVQAQGLVNPNGGGNPLNIARYKKTVYTVAWIQFALFACYAPYIIMTMRYLNKYGSLRENFIAVQFLVCFVNFNSSLNPLIYCWRIRDVRQQVKNAIRKCVHQSKVTTGK